LPSELAFKCLKAVGSQQARPEPTANMEGDPSEPWVSRSNSRFSGQSMSPVKAVLTRRRSIISDGFQQCSPSKQVLARAEPDAGAKEFLRIDGFAVDACLVMKMRTGRTAGRADFANDLSDLDWIANLHADFGEVAVAGR